MHSQKVLLSCRRLCLIARRNLVFETVKVSSYSQSISMMQQFACDQNGQQGKNVKKGRLVIVRMDTGQGDGATETRSLKKSRKKVGERIKP